MTRLYVIIICLHLFCSAFSQQIRLVKSTVGPAGSSIKCSGRYSLNYTIGQSSLINGFHSSSTRLLQGFQFHFDSDLKSEIRDLGNFSIYPNPSSGRVTILWQDDLVSEQLDISLYDLQGKLVDKVFQQRNGNKIEADFTKVSKGIYELIVVGEKSGSVKSMLFIN